MNRWLFYILFVPVFGYSADLFQFNTYLGYRRDDVRISFSETCSASDLLNGVEIGSSMRVFAGRMVFAFNADVGWYVSGSGINALSLKAPQESISTGRFRHHSGGFFTDGQVNFGYAFRSKYWDLLPQASFGLFYQQVKWGENHPSPNSELTSSDLSYHKLKCFWFGPGAGSDFLYRPHPAWTFSVGYFYYLVHFDERFTLFSDLTYASPSFSEYFVWQKYLISTPAHGQKISAKMEAQVAANWRFNLCFDAYLFSAENKRGSVKNEFQQRFPTGNSFSLVTKPKTSASWQAYLAFVEIEYFF